MYLGIRRRNRSAVGVACGRVGAAADGAAGWEPSGGDVRLVSAAPGSCCAARRSGGHPDGRGPDEARAGRDGRTGRASGAELGDGPCRCGTEVGGPAGGAVGAGPVRATRFGPGPGGGGSHDHRLWSRASATRMFRSTAGDHGGVRHLARGRERRTWRARPGCRRSARGRSATRAAGWPEAAGCEAAGKSGDGHVVPEGREAAGRQARAGALGSRAASRRPGVTAVGRQEARRARVSPSRSTAAGARTAGHEGR